VFLCPCEFARELRIILFPLDKIFESIPCNDHNFNMVIATMFGCDMWKPIEMVQEEEIALFPLEFKLNPFPLKPKKVHSTMFLYLQHPQPFCHLGVL